MTEDYARDWLKERHGEAALAKLAILVELILAENERQNLVAPSTVTSIWSRHIVDSAQLLDLVPAATSKDRWIDIGSGAGFPGLVVAALGGGCKFVLVEPRKRRAAFLAEAVVALGLSSVTVKCCTIERVNLPASIISARAVAPISTLLAWGTGCSTQMTRWILPKGRSACEEVATAQQAWQGVFHVEQSITDPESMIVLASGVTRR